MPKSVVILKDVMDAPLRLQSLRVSHPDVRLFCPHDFNIKGAQKVEVPEDWLPEADWEYRRKCWYKADAMGHWPAKDIPADFYWFVESDVSASPEVWRRLFADTENNRADLLSNPVRSREQSKDYPFWNHGGTPEWAGYYFLMPVYRLSRKALEACVAEAVALRNCFGEIATASVVHQAGLKSESVNEHKTYWNTQTFHYLPNRVITNPRYVNHPVKTNTLSP